MRDELEALLEEDEEETEDTPELFPDGTVPPRIKSGQRESREKSAGVLGDNILRPQMGKRAEDMEDSLRHGKNAAETMEEGGVGETEKDLYSYGRLTSKGYTGAMEGPQRRREAAAERFYRELRSLRQAADRRAPQREESVHLVRELGEATAGNLDAAGIDRLFQRDARRYDGGFTWQ